MLEGTVSSQLEGEPAHVYHHGENWSEQPGAHHLATENTSPTNPAKLLVVFIATTGEPLKVDDPDPKAATLSHSGPLPPGACAASVRASATRPFPFPFPPRSSLC